MKEWKEVKLGDVTDVIGGGTPSTKKESYWGGDIPWLTPRDLSNFSKRYIFGGERYITREGYENSSTQMLPKNSVLMSSRAPIGYLAIAGVDVCTNQGFKSFVLKDNGPLNNLFLYYWLKSKADYLQQLGTGTTFAEISAKVVKSIPIFLPPLKEQKAIAEVLSNLDDKIELLQQQNETLEQLAETLFRQWFIEEAEEDWEEKTLGDVINLYDYKRVPLSKIERSKMKDGQLYPYYGAATIMDYVNSYIFEGNYILMAEDGSVLTEEGYPVLQYARGKFWVNNHTHIMTGKPPYSNSFIWVFLKNKKIQQYITGAVQPKLNQKNLKSIAFPHYPQDRVFYYTKIVSPYFTKIESNQLQIQTLTKMRDTLLPKLMSGAVRVKLAD